MTKVCRKGKCIKHKSITYFKALLQVELNVFVNLCYANTLQLGNPVFTFPGYFIKVSQLSKLSVFLC